MKINKKIVVSILIAMLLCSAFVGVAFGFISGQSPNTNNADYVTIEGVAGTDNFDSRQWSYRVNQWAIEDEIDEDMKVSYPELNPANMWFNARKSIRMGMTEFGEFATPAYTGIAYGANAAEWRNTESWASTGINPALYIQGWVFYMNYTRQAIRRAFEAYAVFSDTSTVESGRKAYSWDGNYNPSSTGNGIVTAGSLGTSGIQMLYDSARLAVGRTTVVMRDGYYNEDVAKVTFTIIVNKDTKYAIIYKDVKILLDPKVLDIIHDLAFSERYEIDVARNVNPSNAAFVHYFDNFDESVYQHPLTGSNNYDIVQAFDEQRQYTFFAAYWPNTTEFSVYAPLVPMIPQGYTRVLPYATRVADIPTSPDGPGEPSTPWIIAQWRYQSWNPNIADNYFPNMLHFLAKDANREIRFVEIAGMTDYNMGSTAYAPFRALDVDAGDNYHNVDTEIRFMVHEVLDMDEDLGNTMYNQPYLMWTAVGQTSQPVDSLGATQAQGIMSNASLSFSDIERTASLGLLDKAETSLGTIPYGLDKDGNYTDYYETFSNTVYGKGNDVTPYMRTGLQGFAFNYYDAATAARRPPQPIAGGQSLTGTDTTPYWYPSKNPLDERWSGSSTFTFAPYAYDLTAPSPLNVNGILTVGGPKANALTRYFNDFNFVIDREGTSNYALVNGGSVSGTAPTSNPSVGTLDFFPLSSWNTGVSTFNYKAGYAVISLARDINGTRGISIYGWDGRDTYWASAWAAEYLNGNFTGYWRLFPEGTMALVLKINYSGADREPVSSPPAFTIVKALGTITEFGDNRFVTAYGFDKPAIWTGYIGQFSRTGSGALPPGGQWFFAKLPTIQAAKVDFDP